MAQEPLKLAPETRWAATGKATPAVPLPPSTGFGSGGGEEDKWDILTPLEDTT